MSANYEELDFKPTRLGDLMLRRRRLLSLDGLEIFEIKLGDSFLMSSLFHDVEVALANLGLAELQGEGWDVAVGGLGLGYTAVAALENPAVGSLVVIDTLSEVIEWHRTGLVPLGNVLTADPRCRFVHADFFDLVEAPAPGLDPTHPGRLLHAILLDIDHSPRSLLHPRNAALYTPEGLRHLAKHLHPGGIFAMWSDDPPDEEFHEDLQSVFIEVRSHVVTFHNPLLETNFASTVYVARLAGG
jgi:spermidine synthase